MPAIIDTILIAFVWAGHPVGFDFLTHGDLQIVAYYDAERRMTIASRQVDAKEWTTVQPKGRMLPRRKRLSSVIGWDSHNYLTMAIDTDGHIHLSGNLHVDPLIYFRTTRPLDITSLERVDRMIGRNEGRCTYPRFMVGGTGDLVFRYRDGSSGNGVDFYNVYDPKTRSWRRLLDKPLLDGQDKMNAYARMPALGPDGLYHMIWMWRDAPDCATNHDISYARSRDLVNWETSRGVPLSLPITLSAGDVVDPVPPGGGMINPNQALGFDAEKRPIVSYHKFDADGNTQVYNARLEDGKWRIYQTTDWTHRWEFKGGGSVGCEVRVGPVRAEEDGDLSQHFRYDKEASSGTWLLDPATLKPIDRAPPKPSLLPGNLRKPESTFPGMHVRLKTSRGEQSDDSLRYVLRWETLGPNRDRPRPEAPPPSELRLYVVRP